MRKSKYNQEFKDSAIKLCLDSDKSISSIAKDLGLNKESLEEENKRLKKELAVLKQEKEILKKAAAYFAKETL